MFKQGWNPRLLTYSPKLINRQWFSNSIPREYQASKEEHYRGQVLSRTLGSSKQSPMGLALWFFFFFWLIEIMICASVIWKKKKVLLFLKVTKPLLQTKPALRQRSPNLFHRQKSNRVGEYYQMNFHRGNSSSTRIIRRMWGTRIWASGNGLRMLTSPTEGVAAVS